MNNRILHILMTAFIAAFLLSGCVNDIAEVKKVTTMEVLPVETIENAEILYSEEARIKVKVEAPLIDRYAGEKPYSEMTKGINVIFYDSAMHVTSHLTANYAIDKMSEDIMEARGNVVVVNEKNETLNTEHLIWDKKNARIYSNVYVKITTDDEVIQGTGFESDQEFTRYKIKGSSGQLKNIEND